MNDEILSILAHARIEEMLREADYYRRLIEYRPIPAQGPPPLATVRRFFATALYRAAEAIAVNP